MPSISSPSAIGKYIPGAIANSVLYVDGASLLAQSASGLTWDGSRLSIGAASTTSKLGVVIGTSTTVGLSVKGVSGQTANLTEWQNSAGTVLASVDANGNLTKIRSVVYSFPSSQGASNTFLQNDGSGNLSWVVNSVSPGGSNSYVQFNSSGSFGGDSNFVWDNANKRLGVGTTPTYLLHVKDAITNSSSPADKGIICEDSQASVRRGGFILGGGNDWVVGAMTDHDVNIASNNQPRIRLRNTTNFRYIEFFTNDSQIVTARFTPSSAYNAGGNLSSNDATRVLELGTGSGGTTTYPLVVTNNSSTASTGVGIGFNPGVNINLGTITTVRNAASTKTDMWFGIYSGSGGAVVEVFRLSSENYGALITNRATTTVGLGVRGIASQTANLLQCENSSGTPLANIDKSGVVTGAGFASTLATKTGAYTLTNSDSIILANATSAAFAVTLPSPATVTSGRVFTIKKIDSSANSVTLNPSSTEKIDGASSYVLSSQNSTVQVCTDNTNWYIVSKF